MTKPIITILVSGGTIQEIHADHDARVYLVDADNIEATESLANEDAEEIYNGIVETMETEGMIETVTPEEHPECFPTLRGGVKP